MEEDALAEDIEDESNSNLKQKFPKLYQLTAAFFTNIKCTLDHIVEKPPRKFPSWREALAYYLMYKQVSSEEIKEFTTWLEEEEIQLQQIRDEYKLNKKSAIHLQDKFPKLYAFIEGFSTTKISQKLKEGYTQHQDYLRTYHYTFHRPTHTAKDLYHTSDMPGKYYYIAQTQDQRFTTQYHHQIAPVAKEGAYPESTYTQIQLIFSTDTKDPTPTTIYLYIPKKQLNGEKFEITFPASQPW